VRKQAEGEPPQTFNKIVGLCMGYGALASPIE